MLKHSLIMGMENNDKKCYTRQNTHYDSSPDYLWLTEMGDTAGFFTSKARFIPLGIAFGGCRKRVGFIRFEKGEIFWKKTKGTAEGTSKDLDNSVIKLPCANRLVILYPFVYIVLSQATLSIDLHINTSINWLMVIRSQCGIQFLMVS